MDNDQDSSEAVNRRERLWAFLGRERCQAKDDWTRLTYPIIRRDVLAFLAHHHQLPDDDWMIDEMLGLLADDLADLEPVRFKEIRKALR